MVISHLAEMPGELKKDALSPLVPSATGFALQSVGVLVGLRFWVSSD